MRYVMKQKLFSLGEDFRIRDEDGNDVYFVDGKAFRLGDQLSFEDMQKNELAFIKQRLLSWGRTYDVYRGGALYATIRKKKFTFLKCKFMVDVAGPDDFDVTGDFYDHEYAFIRNGQTVAQVSKRWFRWADTYGVDIADGEDDIVILATTVAIDMSCHSDRDG